MKTLKYAAAAAMLSLLSFNTFAAQSTTTVTPVTNAAAQTQSPLDVEAGSSIVKTSDSTGRSMDDAFDVHTLVAGEWY